MISLPHLDALSYFYIFLSVYAESVEFPQGQLSSLLLYSTLSSIILLNLIPVF